MHAAIRELGMLFNEGAVGMLSDGSLLDRFVERRDTSAFEAIVERYGPLVWGVCRRVLRDHHDAEDAFQATFLVLARKAASVMPREKLGNWLYGVAFQTAMNAKMTRAKRRVRERPAWEITEPEAVPHEPREELLSRLDREVARLPEKYRRPIILCELEGKTHRQAAAQLGWPVGTVSGRLSRAKAMLASRLSRRDATLTVGALGGLLAADLAQAGVPPGLVRSTAQAASLSTAGTAVAAGAISAQVAALTGEVLKTMLINKLRLATAILLVTLALAAGGTSLTYRAHATEPANPKKGPENPKERSNPTQEPAPSKSVPAARSTPTPTPPEKPVGVPITGRIVDLEGRPVAGVTVQVKQISRPKSEDLDNWIEAAGRGEAPWTAYKHLASEPGIKGEDKRLQAITDAKGRFRVDGIGAERLVDLAIQGPTIAYTRMNVVTRRMEPVAAPGFASQYSPGSQTIHGSDFIHTAAPGRPVEGIVRDAKTKQPLANVEIRSDRFAGTHWVGTQDLRTTTDAQGRFQLVGLPKGRGNGLIVVPNDDQPYFMQEVAAPDPPGVAPISLEIALHRGIWIEGKVTDQETGSPAPGCWLEYFPFLDNPFAGVTPEFDKNNGNMPAGFSIQDRYQTRADGSYRLVGLPGRALVGVMSYAKKPYLQGAGSESIKGMDAHGHFPTYRNPIDPGKHWPTSLKEINPPEGTETVHLDFALVAGMKVRVRAVDRAGKPVAGLSLAGRTRRGNHEWNVKHEAQFDVVTLAPGEDRMVLVVQEERKLGRAFHVKPGDDKDGPVTVTLDPLATLAGRVTDADGNPVSGATIRTDPLPGGDFSLSLASRIASDSKGRFVVPNVPTGCNYAVAIERGSGTGNRFTFLPNAAVRPGETTDVGDVAFKND